MSSNKRKRQEAEQEDVEKAWRDFESIITDNKQGKNANKRQRMAIDCTGCGGDRLLAANGQLVCTECGVCQPDYKHIIITSNLYNKRGDGTDFTRERRESARYDPAFHLNERLRQLNCTDPFPAAGYWKNMQLAFSTLSTGQPPVLENGPGNLTKEDVAVVLDHASRYSPSKHCLRPDKTKKVYMERWISIRYALTGQRPPPLTLRFIEEICIRFLSVVKHWEKVRHSKLCINSRPRSMTRDQEKAEMCHKKYGCRNNLPNFNWMMRQFIYDILEHPSHPSLLQFREILDFPYIDSMKTRGRVEILEEYWRRLYPYTKLPLYFPITSVEKLRCAV